LSAFAGSTRVARLAGIQQARSADGLEAVEEALEEAPRESCARETDDHRHGDIILIK
jgi:hypothetical protein